MVIFNSKLLAYQRVLLSSPPQLKALQALRNDYERIQIATAHIQIPNRPRIWSSGCEHENGVRPRNAMECTYEYECTDIHINDNNSIMMIDDDDDDDDDDDG